jgi:hypothetical protein
METSILVLSGAAFPVPASRRTTQNCPAAEPSSVASGSVQTATAYAPTRCSVTIGNGGPLCAPTQVLAAHSIHAVHRSDGTSRLDGLTD